MSQSRKTKDRTDGRRLRSEASRERIVRAMLELIEAGEVSPRAEEVAARAGVGLRTVFRHFDNMEVLYRQIDSLIQAEVRPVVERPFGPDPWPRLLHEMIDRRTRIFERIMPFKIASEAHRHHSPFLDSQMTVFAQAQRAALLAAMPRELRKNTNLVESLDLALSFEAWRRLRKDQNLSLAKARRALEHLVAALVGPF